MEIKRSRIEKPSVVLKISRSLFDSYIQKAIYLRMTTIEAILQSIM